MLVLSRHKDERIIIGGNIVITVIDIRGDKVRIGIEAPRELTVHREEVVEAIQRDGLREKKEETTVEEEVCQLPAMRSVFDILVKGWRNKVGDLSFTAEVSVDDKPTYKTPIVIAPNFTEAGNYPTLFFMSCVPKLRELGEIPPAFSAYGGATLIQKLTEAGARVIIQLKKVENRKDL